jgi:hypothetical protein
MPTEFASRSDDRVRAVVDGTGRLVDLTVSSELLRSPARNVAQAVFTAVTEAQVAAAAATGPGLEQHLADALAEVTRDADRRLAELATLVSDVSRRVDLS